MDLKTGVQYKIIKKKETGAEHWRYKSAIQCLLVHVLLGEHSDTDKNSRLLGPNRSTLTDNVLLL